MNKKIFFANFFSFLYLFSSGMLCAGWLYVGFSPTIYII